MLVSRQVGGGDDFTPGYDTSERARSKRRKEVQAMTREANETELSMLWDAVTDDHRIEQASDGRRRWAFLLDFDRNWVSDVFGSVAGAIVHAEDGHGPIGAWFYSTAHELEAAWAVVFEPARMSA
jgi:hypothetical protein